MSLTLYDCQTAPSPRRARILLAEKQIAHATVQIDLASGEQFSDAYRALNPACTVPALGLEDGTIISENAGIAAYLEAAYPETPLAGRDPRERGLVAMWNARVEFEGLLAVADTLRNSSAQMKDRALPGARPYAQIPELAERGRARIAAFFELLDSRLHGRDFLAIDVFSLADITAAVTVDFARWVKVRPTAEQVDLNRWLETMKARPSFAL